MSNVTEAGRVFIREGTPLPETLRIESEPYVSGWRLVKDLNGDTLGRKIQEKGWTFFSLAGHIRATILGRERQKVVSNAVQRMLTKLKSEKFNSLEITEVVVEAFPRSALCDRLRPLAPYPGQCISLPGRKCSGVGPNRPGCRLKEVHRHFDSLNLWKR